MFEAGWSEGKHCECNLSFLNFKKAKAFVVAELKNQQRNWDRVEYPSVYNDIEKALVCANNAQTEFTVSVGVVYYWVKKG